MGKKKKDKPADDGGEQQSFGSFKDLLKSTGGDAGKETEPADTGPGWTLDTGDDPDPDPDPADFPDASGSGRERIDSRPRAFGPMDSGPACYRDTGSEEMTLLHSFQARTVFPDDVQAEIAALPEDPSESDFLGRVDLRGETIFTIDGEDARDYDDAISIRKTAGGWEIGVHIADVSHYVTPGTALDDEALARATSVYVADQVVPMLPEGLSNHLCSLVADRPRLAYSVIMTFNEQGERTDARVHKSVIQSVKRNTYRAVQELLDGEDTPDAREIAFLAEPLREFERWAKVLQARREREGALRMQSTERKFVFDDAHEVTAIVDAPRYFSQALIEETALAANQAVGDLFRARGLPTIYRVHPEKDPEEIAAVAQMLTQHGLHLPDKPRITGRDVARLIRAARKKKNAEALIMRIMGLIERAVYEVHDHEDVATHFGLAREAYLHFTSPIRRYPDLIVHRWLWAIETRPDEAAEELSAVDFLADLNQIAQHCSLRADLAEMTERAVADLKVCQYMDPHVGEKLAARVVSVAPYGMQVHLTEYNVRAFLPTKSIGGRGTVKGDTLQVQIGRSYKSFSEGHPIVVVLEDVDFLRLQLFLKLG